ncbi:DEAD/DEAH box helicase [Kaustia mangrovi]|uniref:DEAD/DEAH box helicase n=1 Tax=Kaustia mangrovi TaxID=2593653 RepID=A0A7S8C5Z6_9HYPH|nr:DEAD/DEAH box helicase [Kaustia mangrovi]QPC44030.1 DEAD/DEAH box helicase [Kaustia mangrovi]
MLPLRDYQARGVEQLRESYRRGARAPVYVLPTGGGKTVVFCHIGAGVAQRNRRAWVLVHRQELLEQCSRSLHGIGLSHGLVAPGYTPAPQEPIQVCSVQTLVRRIDKGAMRDVDLIIIDEAHHATAGTWRKIINARPEARLLGVTATPARTDGQGLGVQGGGVFDDMIVGPGIADLISAGHLSKPAVFAPPSQLDLSGVKMRGGDFAKGDMARAVDKPTITGDAVEHYGKICPGMPAIAFCASVDHAKHVAAQFRAAGYRAESLDGEMPSARRRALIEALGSGAVDVLTSCEIVSEGTDIPVVGAAILLRPTASQTLYLQQVGRALRPSPGKDRAIILDHVGNCLRHGLPDDDREWSLAGMPKRKGKGAAQSPDVKINQCPECFMTHPPAPQCPECGHVYEPDAQSGPKQVEGELAEITDAQAEAMRRAKRRQVGRAQTLDDLKAIAAQRGYKPGWAEHVYRARQRRRGAA